MRRLYIFILLVLAFIVLRPDTSTAQSGQELVDICNSLADGATYLKDFPVKLDGSKPGEEPEQAIHSVLLKKGMKYRFLICNSRDYSGEAVLKIYDANRLLGSTYIVATGKSYPSVDLKIEKTGVYHIFISFKDGEQGMAVALLTFVEAF